MYWRDADGSIHGNNLTLPVNFMAIAFGICDDPGRRDAILARAEAEMEKAKLFCWPVNIFPFPADETNNQPFPTYENGDIFLAWAETGIRAYASSDPAIAVKYVKNVMAQYGRDGLAFQRYLRGSQAGAGDDILANNCSAVVGLYRDIYGIRPRHDRLYLDPHLTPELWGTRLSYWLRGKTLEITLEKGRFGVAAGGRSVTGGSPFGVDFGKNSATYFPDERGAAALTVTGRSFSIQVRDWGETKRFRVEGKAIAGKVMGLTPNSRYRVDIGSKRIRRQASASGSIDIDLARGGEVTISH